MFSCLIDTDRWDFSQGWGGRCVHRHRDSFVFRDLCCGLPYVRRVLQRGPSGRCSFIP